MSEQKYLLALARHAIMEKLGMKTNLNENPKEQDFPVLYERRGVFVTLTESGKLRGCIGNIFAVNSIKDAVSENAVAAAFDDPRFNSVQENEINELEIEISILSKPEIFKYSSIDELLAKLEKEHPGVVIKSGPHKATFLPQVWDEIADAETFLSHLCMKAGLDADYWRLRNGNLSESDDNNLQTKFEVSLYTVLNFKESDFDERS